MGSEVSIENKSPETKHFVEDMEMQHKGNVGATKTKGTRSRLYAEDFYCTMVTDVCNEESEKVLHVKKPVVASQTPVTTRTLTLSIQDDAFSPLTNISKIDESICSHDSEHEPQETKMTPASEEDKVNPSSSHPLVDGDYEIDAKVEKAIAVDARRTSKLGFFHLENIEVIPSNLVDAVDIYTNTSQPIYTETAVGSSQPEMMEAFTEMSQKEVKQTVECGIQTSQEWIYPQAKSPVVTLQNETEPGCKNFTKSNQPIVFPRVRCQTSGPEIPAKIPRLHELDKKEFTNSIYSSSVTFQFEEDSDKENDCSVLRQRSNWGNGIMNKETSYSCSSKARDTIDEVKENVLTNDDPSLNEFAASRGTFLRVGLSKKSRNRIPLHPRKSFGNERNTPFM